MGAYYVYCLIQCTISSGLNSLAGVGIQDVFLPIYKHRSPDREINFKKLALISRLLAVFLGFVTTGIAVILIYASPNILRIILNIFGATGGPIFLLHTMGIFFPFINNWGACAGFVVSVVGTMWVSIGGIFRNTIADIPGRPPSTDACPAPNITTLAPNLTTLAQASQSQPLDRDFSFYDLSFLWLTAFAFLIGFMVASIVSLLSGMNTKKPVRQSLLASQAVCLYNRFPNCHPIQSYDDSEMQVGLKGVVWTDVIQLLIMLIDMITILVTGLLSVDGPVKLWQTALMDGKIDQIRAILLNIPINVLFTVLHVAVGLISYVYFRGCDPKLNDELSRYDMLFPFLTLKLFANIPVLRGLFLSVIFAAAFRFVSDENQ
nr:unnamed protein product [Spirometra erinaceieuropaei]